jgi:DMSO/TMAO reductase YedYZ molybdopterin-dependent catalytic subunit
MPETDRERAARYAELEASYPTMTAEEYQRRTRRSLLTGGAAALAGLAGWRWIQNSPEDMNIPAPLRDVHEVNESLWRALYRGDKLAPTFDRSASSMIRVNGRRGISNEIDLDTWSMSVRDEGTEIATHTMDDLTDLPKQELTVEHKCVEGWSHVVTWGGVRFTDFLEAHHPETLMSPPEYVSLETPDRGFYVGLEWAAMLHPQTLLASELQGRPLDQEHGAPLRLVTPLKYGIKQLKRIGVIEFTNARPADFWAERGYDWYAGL